MRSVGLISGAGLGRWAEPRCRWKEPRSRWAEERDAGGRAVCAVWRMRSRRYCCEHDYKQKKKKIVLVMIEDEEEEYDGSSPTGGGSIVTNEVVENGE